VKISDDPGADLLAIGKDSKGRPQYVYSEKFAKTQAALKFSRIKSLEKDMPMIQSELADLRKSSDRKAADHADCATLIMRMGIRPGSDSDTQAKVKAYGATTLEGQHVVHEDGEIYLRFIGKKGVNINLRVEDQGLARSLYERSQRAGANGRLFGEVSDGTLRDFVREQLDHGGYHPKDFRTYLGTTEAQKIVETMPAPKGEKEYKKAVMGVAKQVSAKLGNTPVICLQSYIAPEIFTSWRQSYGAA
jgi:DNA topoisomerase-1